MTSRPHRFGRRTSDFGLLSEFGLRDSAFWAPDFAAAMSTLKITIDGRSIEVAAGTTILAAARRLGICDPHALPRRRLRAIRVVLPVRGEDRRAAKPLAVLRHARRGGHGGDHRFRRSARGAQDLAGAAALRSRGRLRRAVPHRLSGAAGHPQLHRAHLRPVTTARRRRLSRTTSRCRLRWAGSVRGSANNAAASATWRRRFRSATCIVSARTTNGGRACRTRRRDACA